MKNTVITKRIDELGRIVLPKDFRKRLDIALNSEVELKLENECLVITKVHDECIFCHSHDDLIEFKSKKICKNCINSLK